MGADTYCFICSMPPYFSEYFRIEDFNITSLNKNLQKSLKDIEKTFKSNCKYLNNLTILTFDDKIKPNSENEGNYGEFFDSDKNEYNITGEDWEANISYCNINKIATWLHTDCYNFVCKTLKIKLLASHIPFLLPTDVKKKKLKSYKHHQLFLEHIDYGEITKYCNQYFNYTKIINDKNEWMCFGYNNDKNIARIKKVVNQFKIKSADRSGPIISASYYPDGIIKLGNNEKFWIIKNNKWTEIKENVIKFPFSIPIKDKEILDNKLIKKNKLIKIINSIPQKSLYNRVPIFLSDIIYWQDEKRVYLYTFDIITIPHFEKDILKIYSKF